MATIAWIKNTGIAGPGIGLAEIDVSSNPINKKGDSAAEKVTALNNRNIQLLIEKFILLLGNTFPKKKKRVFWITTVAIVNRTISIPPSVLGFILK
ncbi:hypothetical protein KBC31_02665 [Candidatus Saccharibacteria bacterium]|jgi:hypothetical protein|nr:hypothetical protein [Candidatus Saccharibacteria bacterium]